MDISRINTPPITPPGRQVSSEAHARAAAKQAEQREKQQEKVTLGQQDDTAALTYDKPRKSEAPQQVDLTAMLEESDRKAGEMLQLLGNLIQKQGLEWKKVVSGEQKLSADPETIKAAQAAIAEDGEFGVRKTAERILSFARSMIGDDPSRLEAVRDAVSQGFDQAKEMLGGALPDISQQTYDTIMAEFDRWATDGLPGDTSISLKPAEQSSSSA
ncbi:hypothetical protein ACFOLG_15340 [Vogesella facilis]|uniref:DUF5610 domain-containing protein n=1 Tax=Vogesella facilis TaxID=1655232 RepID=A0ABV7RJN0_9NEIS